MPRQYKFRNVRLLTLLILTNGCPFIISFQAFSKARVGSLRSTHQQKWAAITRSSSSPSWPLFGHDKDEESSEDSPYPEYEFFLGRTNSALTGAGSIERAEHRVLEGFEDDDVYEFSSQYCFSNILEYKDNRDPMESSKSAFVYETEPLTKRLTSMDEVYQLAVKKNLPKKKPISIHSFISSMSAMAALVLLLPTFHPGVDDFGFPRLFTYEYASNDLLWQSQLVALLQMVGSILGVFRLPKRSPNVRTAGFVLSALIVTQLSLVVMSSLNGTDVYLFDAFSMQGRVLISVINTTLLIGSFDSIAVIMGDKEKEGWETVPNYSSRPAAFSAVFPFHILICITGNAVLPVLCDKESFLENALPFFGIFPGVQTLGYVAISLSVGLGALLATLQFEKKITSEVASFWNIFVIAFLTYDSVKFMYLLGAFPDRFPHSEYFVSYTPHLQSLWHTNEVLTVGTVLSFLFGLYNLSQTTTLASASRKRNSQVAMPLALEAPSATNELTSLEDRAYQIVIDLERIQEEKKNSRESENPANNPLD